MHHFFQQNLRETANAQNMLAGFNTAVFDNRRHCFHHRIAGFAQGFRLFLHHSFQILLVQMQRNDILNAMEHGIRLIVHGNDIGCAQTECPVQAHRVIIFRKDDNRHTVQERIIFLLTDQFFIRITHLGDIQQKCRDAACILIQQQHGLIHIDGFQQIKAFSKHIAQVRAVFCTAARNEQGIMSFHNPSSRLIESLILLYIDPEFLSSFF